jgi:hypothetical protein
VEVELGAIDQAGCENGELEVNQWLYPISRRIVKRSRGIYQWRHQNRSGLLLMSRGDFCYQRSASSCIFRTTIRIEASMSSAGAMPPPYDAVVYRDEHIVGPIRLPVMHPERFVEQFQKTYGRLGIRVSSTVNENEPAYVLSQKQKAEETD